MIQNFKEFVSNSNIFQIKFTTFGMGMIQSLKNLMKINTEIYLEGIKEQEAEFHKKIKRTGEWQSKGWKERVLWTPSKDIKIRRRIYESTGPGKKRYKILFDKELGLVPNKYVQPCFYPIFFQMLIHTYSYESLMEILDWRFSTSTISNIMKEIDVSLVPKELQRKTPLLIVNVDDIWIKVFKQKKRAMRMALAYTSQNRKGKNGRQILDKKDLNPYKY